MPTERQIEAAALAFWGAGWGRLPEDSRDFWRSKAKAALEAAELAEGLRTEPAPPTSEDSET